MTKTPAQSVPVEVESNPDPYENLDNFLGTQKHPEAVEAVRVVLHHIETKCLRPVEISENTFTQANAVAQLARLYCASGAPQFQSSRSEDRFPEEPKWYDVRFAIERFLSSHLLAILYTGAPFEEAIQHVRQWVAEQEEN